MLNREAGQIFDFLRENFYRHALEYFQPDRAKCGAFCFFASAVKKHHFGVSVVRECVQHNPDSEGRGCVFIVQRRLGMPQRWVLRVIPR